MALFSRKALFETITPFIQAKRFRGKINIQKPKPPHFERAKYLAVANPYYESKRKDIPLVQLCEKKVNIWSDESKENPFQRIIANEVHSLFETSKLIAFYHMNPMKADQQFKAYVLFKKANMFYKNYGKKTMEMALKGTPYEAVLSLLVSHNMFVFSPEIDIKKLLKVNKKFPQLVLMAGVMHGQFVSKDQLMYYSNIPNLATAQAGLVQTLNSIGGQIVSQLNSHQNVLVSQLSERIKQLDEEK